MPKVARGRRQRAYRPKTRSGCLTCKSKNPKSGQETERVFEGFFGGFFLRIKLTIATVRRVKCDEARPACLRCTSTGRVCEGYSHIQPPVSPGSNIVVPVTVIAGLPFDIDACPQSKQSFAFFVQRTSPQLAGFFGSDFWERLILQAAYHESAVRHAAVAVGSVHQLSEHHMTDASRTFALEQYNLAIRHLIGPSSQNGERGVDVCLISCILFICFEVHPILYMFDMPCRHIPIDTNDLRTYKGAIPPQDPISKAAQSCYAKSYMTSKTVYFSIQHLGRKAIRIPTLH